MALVKAKTNVYLGEHGGYKTPDDEPFNYEGPDNHNLESIKKSKADAEDDTQYHTLTRDQLKDELNKRGISFAPNAGDKTLRNLLEEDDESK
jgi:hypothetical protein